MGRPLDGRRASSVAGAGGAAHAVVFACLAAGARRVTSATARPRRRTRSRRGSGRRHGSRRVASTATGVRGGARDGGPRGQRDDRRHARPGHDDRRRRACRPTATVFDLVYVPAETPLLAAARARGLRAANGSEMLIAQAAIAFERWTGVGGMADVMRAAVAPLLADPTVRA